MKRTYGTATLVGNEWIVRAEPHVLIRLKRVFPRLRQDVAGGARFEATDETTRDLEWFIQRFPLELSEHDWTVLEYRARRYDDRVASFSQVVAGKQAPRAFDLALPPRDYQATAAELALRTGGLLVADDLGLGKSCVGIATLTEPSTRPALVVTLTHLPSQWQREIHKFAPQLTTHIATKATPYKLELPDVLIMNYHKVYGWADVLAGLINTVVFDECQELRRDESQKYIGCKIVADESQYRIGLSATPIYNYGGEIYNVVEVLRPDALGSHAEFIREWCVPSGKPGKEQVRDPAAFGSYMRDAGIMLRRTRAEVGRELPPLQKIPHTIESDTSTLEEAEDAASELASIILSQNAAWDERGRASRELDWRLRQATGIAKSPYVAEFVKMLLNSGEKVVLYGWHRAVYDVWKERLKGYRPVFFTGSESPKQKDHAREEFVEGDSRVLVMSLRAGAGLDGLQSQCRTIVFGELDWSYGVMEQCIGRVFRDGQTAGVNAYYLIADEGSDPVVADVLGVKKTQITRMRDPHDEPVVDAVDPDHIKRLAAAYLERHVG